MPDGLRGVPVLLWLTLVVAGVVLVQIVINSWSAAEGYLVLVSGALLGDAFARPLYRMYRSLRRKGSPPSGSSSIGDGSGTDSRGS